MLTMKSRCRAATRPSPPLLPGPHTTSTLGEATPTSLAGYDCTTACRTQVVREGGGGEEEGRGRGGREVGGEGGGRKQGRCTCIYREGQGGGRGRREGGGWEGIVCERKFNCFCRYTDYTSCIYMCMMMYTVHCIYMYLSCACTCHVHVLHLYMYIPVQCRVPPPP